MARLTIFLPDDLVTELDARAEAEGRSRSSVIREASAQYLSAERAARLDAQRQSAVEDSLALFGQLAARAGLDGRPSLEVLREMRGPLDREPPDTGEPT